MTDFTFRTSLNVKCGCNIVDTLGSELKQMGFSHVLFVTDPGLRKAGASERIEHNLTGSGITFDVFDSIEPNPRDLTIEKNWELVKNRQIQAVVGLGGGSALDGAKASAVLATNSGKLRDYDGPGRITNAALPIVAIPTTAGTGSEVTSNAAITDSARHYKMSLRSPHIIPSLCLLDPSLLATLPARTAAESSMDAIIHAAEALVSNRSNPISDALAVDALEYLCPNIRPFIAARNNLAVGEKMLLGSLFAGMVIGNTGTGNDHALARALGGACDVGHGLACSLMFPYVVRFNFIANPPKYRTFAQALGLQVTGKSDSKVCDMLVEELFRLLSDIGIPSRLGDIGLADIDIKEVAKVAASNSGPNPRSTTSKDLETLLQEAL
jgi:alcohol dehydrogenase class IV